MLSEKILLGVQVCIWRNINNGSSNFRLFGAYVVLQFGLQCKPIIGSSYSEGADKPMDVSLSSIMLLMLRLKSNHVNWPEEKKDDLNPADDGEAGEESHGASNETQLGLRLDLLVSLDVVKGGRVKVDLN